jgi:S-adenosylmethionine:tRNA ribosyltransferase-isomerase
MRISEFDYELPDERIAHRPPRQRGASRLLVMKKKDGTILHHRYSELAQLLLPGDVVVLNDTKVIKARLIALNSVGKERELLLLEKHGSQSDRYRAKCMYRGKIQAGEVLKVGSSQVTVTSLYGGGIAEIESDVELLELAKKNGRIPLPPYMKRSATTADEKRYQTVFAKEPGSVAAPTASLNFTDDLHKELVQKGIVVVSLTLHVGLGTFLPIRSDEVEEHIMHSEYFEIPPDTIKIIQKAKQNNHRIVAIGTTVARTLEFASSDILNNSGKEISGEADIFIYPGYKFKVIDVLLTNFHAPRSTVLMLTAAFGGWKNLKSAYEEAVREKYHFLSYGDSMLII